MNIESVTTSFRKTNPDKRVHSYLRVSSTKQSLDRQLYLKDYASPDCVHVDKATGTNIERPAFQTMYKDLDRNDLVIVHSLDRLCRSVRHMVQVVEDFKKKGVELYFVKEDMYFSNEKNDLFKTLMFNILASMAEFETELRKERQMEGISLAKKKGVYKGRKQMIDEEDLKERYLKGESKREIAIEMGISASSVNNYVRRFKQAGLIPTVTPSKPSKTPSKTASKPSLPVSKPSSNITNASVKGKGRKTDYEAYRAIYEAYISSPDGNISTFCKAHSIARCTFYKIQRWYLTNVNSNPCYF